MSITWNDELDARLRAVWPDRNVTLDAMGAELGKSLSDVSRRAHKLGLPPRNVHHSKSSPSAAADRYLRDEAARRGVTVPVLRWSIIAAVANDRLVSAVLDDEDELRRAA